MLASMKRIASAVSSLLVGLAAASTASADTAEGPLFDSLTLDRHSPVSKVDIDFGFVFFDEPNNYDQTIMGLTFGGQFVEPNSGIGVYGALPLSYLSYEDRRLPGVVVEDSALVLGNVELGGIFSKWMSSRWAMVFHAGVALPTAEDDDALAGAAPAASSPRYIDAVQRIPNSTWLRLGFSPQGRSGGVFWRGDLGVDLALDEDNSTSNLSPILRIGGALGFDLGTAQIMGELGFVNVDDERANNDDDTTGTFAIGARFLAGGVTPGIALILPVEFDTRFAYEPEFAIALSLSARLR